MGRGVWDLPCCAEMPTERVALLCHVKMGRGGAIPSLSCQNTSREGSTPSVTSKWEGECGTFPVALKCQWRELRPLHHVEMGVGRCAMEEGCFCLSCCQNECEHGGEGCQFVYNTVFNFNFKKTYLFGEMSMTAHSSTPIPLLWLSLASKITLPQRQVVVVSCYIDLCDG